MSLELQYKRITLANGFRILLIPKDLPSTTVMVLVKAGSRYEKDNEAGLAHFIEHNVFKGTKKRPTALQIDSEIEAMGGIHNASTGQEYTDFIAKVSPKYTAQALDVILDTFQNPTFPQKDLEIERGNVIEEINMYKDDPKSEVSINFVSAIFENQPLGRFIAGAKETVGAFQRDNLVDFVARFYQPQNSLVVVSGKFNENEVMAKVKEYLESKIKGNISQALTFQSNEIGPRVNLESKETQQTHFCLGVLAFNRHDPRRFALDVASAVLGEGLGSRLFQKIRNQLGLAYYVDSSFESFDDTGLWVISAGVNNSQIDLAIKAILTELKKLKEEEVKDEELGRAKEYLKGHLNFSVETSSGLAGFYGLQELLNKEILSPQEISLRIDGVTKQDIQNIAQELLKTEKLNLALIGPRNNKESLENNLII